MKLHELTAHELLDLLNAEKTSPQEIYQSLRDHISKNDPEIKAYVSLNDAKYDEQTLGQSITAVPIPIAFKSNICIKGEETHCCSQILKGFRPPYDAHVTTRLKQAKVPFLGYTNMDEFAFGSSTENSCFGPTRNPWNKERVPGGSSGGSAAAVAAQEAIWALGSDTGGSIRQPAAFCGVVGLKPTYGRVSRYGLVAFASSLDQIGPLTKDVEDAALLMNLIAGYDEMDSTSVNLPVPNYTQALINDVKGLKIGLPKEYLVEGIEPDVKNAVMKAVQLLEKRGACVDKMSLPHTEYAVATYYIVATSEASSNLARYDGVQYGLRSYPAQSRGTPLVDMYEETRGRGFGDEAKRRIMLGTYSLSAGYYDAYYLRSQKVRTLIKQDFDLAFQKFDVLLTPTSPTTAFKLGERVADPLAMYLSDVFTISVNLSGIPSLSIPCGFDTQGLPIGLQIMAKPFDEETLFRVAYTYEQNTDWHKRRPLLGEQLQVQKF